MSLSIKMKNKLRLKCKKYIMLLKMSIKKRSIRNIELKDIIMEKN
jgi:hypothetical protein